ncbi:MAG: hypothetical protein ACI8RD_004155 [Bacillariaceae sp.]|jgi:hypothetical protein
MSSAINSSVVRQKYRSMCRLIKRLPEESNNQESYWSQIRTSFREPLGVNETALEDRIKKADDRLSFLKMITPKLDHIHPSSSSSNNSATEGGVQGDDDNTTTATTNGGGGSFGGGRWVYKNGERIEISGSSSTVRDSKGRVISNWDGKNLDPDSVKQHNHQLKRMGYLNNSHAKGIF